jgi:hypothetical protein
MHDKPSDAGCEASLNETDDLKSQRVVMTQVLALHPTRLPIPRLVASLCAGSDEFAEGDHLERAILDLTTAGLLDCSGGVVTATPAAIHADCIGVL